MHEHVARFTHAMDGANSPTLQVPCRLRHCAACFMYKCRCILLTREAEAWRIGTERDAEMQSSTTTVCNYLPSDESRNCPYSLIAMKRATFTEAISFRHHGRAYPKPRESR